MSRPFRASLLYPSYPGRCPGLVCHAPAGLGRVARQAGTRLTSRAARLPGRRQATGRGATSRSGGWARCALPILQSTIKPTHISFDRSLAPTRSAGTREIRGPKPTEALLCGISEVQRFRGSESRGDRVQSNGDQTTRNCVDTKAAEPPMPSPLPLCVSTRDLPRPPQAQRPGRRGRCCSAPSSRSSPRIRGATWGGGSKASRKFFR